MADEHETSWMDISKLASAWSLGIKTSVPVRDDGLHTYVYNFNPPPPEQSFSMTVDSADFSRFFKAADALQITYKGRWWFDWSMTGRAKIGSFSIDPETSTCSYIIDMTELSFTANQSRLARFLRWILRRGKSQIWREEGK